MYDGSVEVGLWEEAAVAWDMGEMSWSNSAARALVLIGLAQGWSRRGVLVGGGGCCSPRDGISDGGDEVVVRACTCHNNRVVIHQCRKATVYEST